MTSDRQDVYVWKYLCSEGDGLVTEARLPDEGPPTVCHLNTNHGISGVPVILKTVSPNSVIIAEATQGLGWRETSGFYWELNGGLDPEGTVTRVFGEWPWNVKILRPGFNATASNVGDTIDLYTIPLTNGLQLDGLIGVLPAEVNSGSTVIPIPPSLVPVLQPGFALELDNIANGSGTTNEVDRILSVDSTTNSVTVQRATSDTFPAGTKIKLRIPRLTNFWIVRTGAFDLGEDAIGYSEAPKGTRFMIKYRNRTISTDKKYLQAFVVLKY